MNWKSKAGWRVTVLVAPMALAFATVSRAQQTAAVDTAALKDVMQTAERAAAIEANKGAFVSDLLARWSSEAAARGYDAYWSKGTRKLMAKSAADLLALSERATDLDTFHKLVFEGYTTNAFGSLTQELVFYPMTPCRLYDSRLATVGGLIGPMAPGTQRDISVNDSTSVQGGASPDCGSAVPDLGNDPPALAIVLTAASPTGPGNLRTFAAGAPVPTAAQLTYTAGTTISTGGITASCTSCFAELTIRNQGAGNTDVVVDIVGYFHAPFLQAVDCTTVTASNGSVASNTTVTLTPVCAAGFTVTGGGYNTNLFSSGTANGMVWYRNQPSGNGWNCHAQNFSTATLTADCFARCCRVPGR